MKIVIDARMLYWTGVGRYTKALLDHLEELDTTNNYVVLMRRADWTLWEPSTNNFCKVEANINPYSLAEQLELPRLLNSLAPDLVHFTAPNSPLFYAGRSIVTIHDLTLLDFDTSRGTGLKRVVRGLKRLPFRLVLWAAIRRATAITTGTDYVRQQIIRRFGVAHERVVLAMLAADPLVAAPEMIEPLKVGTDYLLYVNNFYPYKNAGSTLQAFKLLGAKYPHLKLVFTGKPDYFRDALADRVRELGLESRVVFTGFVTDGQLISLYRGAKLFVYPSLSEGFGLQGLEAMAQGVPVLAANASCLPEVYGAAAVYFDPHSPQDQAEKIGDLLANEALGNKLRAAGKDRLKAFSWRETAKITHEVYLKALIT